MRLKKIYSYTIFKQLVVFSLIISSIPLVVSNIMQFSRMKNMMEQEIIISHRQIVSQYMENLEEKLFQYQSRVNMIANSTLVQETLLDTEEYALSRGTRISEEVTKYLMLEQNSDVKNCMIYSVIEEIPAYGKNVSMISLAEREGWYSLIEKLEEGWYSYHYMDQTLLSMVSEIVQNDNRTWDMRQLGIVKLDLKLDNLFEIPQRNEANNYFVYVCDESNQPIYHSKGLDSISFSHFQDEKDKANGNVQAAFTYDSYMVYEDAIKAYDLKIYFFFEKSEFTNIWAEVICLILPMIVILVIVIVIIASLYSKSFSKRIEVLLQKIQNVEHGDLSVQESIEGNDEIAFLDHAIDRMTSQLDNLIQKNYIQKLENKEAQLRNFQLQINPHFLYNTLEIISSIAAVNKTFVICDICERLGDIFRYSIGKNYGEFVTVKQELHHTQNYIFIQQIRFPNHLEVAYNLDEELSEKRIPRFILQPIVENAILHGLVHVTEKGKLEISTREENGCLVICIEDDGEGMSLQKVEELRKYIDEKQVVDDKKQSIGVRNVNQRIKMACGEQYGIQIASALHQGSVFELWLPLL